MLILGLLLTLIVLGFLCWVLFQLAVFALPFFAAVTVGLAVFQGGGGVAGTLVTALLVGVLTLVAGQLLFTLTPSRLLRAMVAAVFVIPAVLAGFHAAHGLMAIGTSSELWRTGVGVLGAGLVGIAALSRLVFRFPEGEAFGPAAA